MEPWLVITLIIAGIIAGIIALAVLAWVLIAVLSIRAFRKRSEEIDHVFDRLRDPFRR